MPDSVRTFSPRWPAIAKPRDAWTVVPNLLAYDGTRAEFSWAAGRAELDGLPDGRGLNIAHETVDRYAAGPRRDRVALRWLAKDGERRDFTYADLRDETSRFANVLKSLGVGKGDPVAVLAGRIPELYIAALGTLKNGSVFTPCSPRSDPSQSSPGSTSLVQRSS
jgi:acetyl-CoA synthetase